MTSHTRSLKAFAIRHDDMPAFHAAYLALTVLIASMLTLGAFVVLIAAHMTLDVVKYREIHGMKWKLVLRGVIRESLLDITLLMVGFTSAVYLHHGAMFAAASGLVRSEETILRAVILVATKSKILFDVLTVLGALPAHLHQILIHPRKPWTPFECFCFGVLGSCAVLLLVLPSLIGIPAEIMSNVFQAQVVPWKI